jgi:FkbH-like protein
MGAAAIAPAERETGEASLLAALRAAVAAGSAPGPELRHALAQVDDPVLLRRIGRLLADLPAAGGELRPIRVTILATCTVGPFEPLLRASLVAAGLLPVIEVGAYGTFDLALPSAGFAADGDPDIVACLLDESLFLPGDWSPDAEALRGHVEARLADLRGMVAASLARTSATLVLHTVPLPAEVRDGLIGSRDRAVLTEAWYRLNAGLLELAREHRQVLTVDLVGALAEAPVAVRDDRLHRYGDLPYTDGALLTLAAEVRRVAQARAGLSRKVLAIDLDDTLWGGVLGEVGAAGVQLGGLYPGNAYLQLQRAVHRLHQQGVVLVLASHNDAEPVERALASHPDMLLRPDAFAVRAVNWAPKAGNLRQAADALGLATGSFVFMDDSSRERALMAGELPEVAVVAADGDPAYLVRSLLRRGWFDVLDLTDTDRRRPELYRARAGHTAFAREFVSPEEYLAALDIRVEIRPVTDFTVPRVAQLAARTSQFNLTGARFDAATTAAMSMDPEYLVVSVGVCDRFGDEGVVGALWVRCEPRTWRVLNMVLSCRVLSRGIELAAAGWLVRQARAAGADAIEGSFVLSGRNGVAADFWPQAGFTGPAGDGVFTLSLAEGAELADPTPPWISLPERSESLT